MKKLTIILASLSLLFLAPVVIAKDKNGEETKVVSIPAGEVVNKDHFAFGDIVEISGTVNGDVYAFGGQVLVDGRVNGDLITAGGVVTISGSVSQDVRAAGGQLTISGEIGGNVTIGGGNIEITDSARVGGGIVAGGGNISLAAPVGKSIKVGGVNLTISNKINGDVEAGVETLRLTSKAKVGGDLTYWSEKDASVDEKAVIGGEVTKKTPPATGFETKKILGAFTGFSLFMKLVSLISTLIVGLFIIKLFPRYSRQTVSTLKNRPWASLGVGVVALILTPIITVLLLVTLVGIPIGLILGAIYAISLYLARIFVIFWAGSWILERTRGKVNEIWALIIGLIVYLVVTSIPIIGSFVVFFTILFGLGAAIITKKEIYSIARKKDII